MVERYSRRTIIPVYVPEERLWYATDKIFAKSLAVLQKKLPGVTFENYYPNGYGNIVRPRERQLSFPWKEPNPVPREPTTIRIDSPKRTEPVKPLTEEPFFKVEQPVPLKKEEPPEPPPPVVEFKPVRRYRYQRTVPTVVKVSWRDPTAVTRLIELLASGMSVVDAAKEMGCTRNAIIGACHRNDIPISGRKPKA